MVAVTIPPIQNLIAFHAKTEATQAFMEGDACPVWGPPHKSFIHAWLSNSSRIDPEEKQLRVSARAATKYGLRLCSFISALVLLNVL